MEITGHQSDALDDEIFDGQSADEKKTNRTAFHIYAESLVRGFHDRNTSHPNRGTAPRGNTGDDDDTRVDGDEDIGRYRAAFCRLITRPAAACHVSVRGMAIHVPP